MLDYNETLKRILNQIALELTTIQISLNKFNASKSYEHYKNDMLRLANSNVDLLATYYMESDEVLKEKFELLLSHVFKTNEEREEFKQQLKNLYYLVKSKLYDTSQYKMIRVEVVNFIEKLKKTTFQDTSDREEERKLLDRMKELKKVKKYFSSDPKKTTVKNIEDLRRIIVSLNMRDIDKTKALMIVFLNELDYYKTMLDNDSDNLEGEINTFLVTAELGNLIKPAISPKVTNATMEDEYRSIIVMLKEHPEMDSRGVFKDFYLKWDKKNRK